MTERFIIESFRQKRSNCACVAFIKALLLDNEMQRTFTVQRRGDNIFIELSDKRFIVLTDKEVKNINRGNQLTFRKPRDPYGIESIHRIREFAELCFALLVRRMQLNGYEGKEYTQSQAIDVLVRKGVMTSHFHLLLGISRTRAAKVSLKNLDQLKRKEGVLIYNKKHIVVASDGWFEEFGKAYLISTKIPLLLGAPATHFYQLQQ